MSFFNELKRRNVFRVAIAYLVVAWLIVQVSDVMIDNIGAPDWVFKSILLVLVIGLPVAIVFAWAFEMTPEGLKREREVDRAQSITGQTGRTLDFIIIGVMAVALAYFIYHWRVSNNALNREASNVSVQVDPAANTSASESAATTFPPAKVATNTVAVLPFVNMSGDAENEYFSDGLTETLLHVLAQIPDLQVAARTSSFAFKGKNESVADIASALGVAHLLEGSVQKANNQVRVTAQLIRAGDGFHVWSQNYTRPLEDIFAIQDEIASDVARALDASLLGNDDRLHSVATSNINAYEIYLKALEQQALISYTSLPLAETLLKNALATDPGFTDAKLALVRNNYLRYDIGQMTIADLERLSQPLLDQVYTTDPDNRLAQLLELTISTTTDSRLNPQERHQKIMEARDLLQYLPTESELRAQIASRIFWRLQLREEGFALLEDGLLVDPMSVTLQSVKGEMLRSAGRLEESLATLLRVDELRPNDSNTLTRIYYTKGSMGDMTAALEWLRRASVADPADTELLAMIAIDLYNLNLPEAANSWANRVTAQAAQTVMGRQAELVRAHTLGDIAQAERLARSMISDQIPNRFFSYGNALFIFHSILTLQGRDAEGLAYLREVKPEFAQYDLVPRNGSDNLTYLAMASFEFMLKTPAELKLAWQKLEDLGVFSGYGGANDPLRKMFSAAMSGNQAMARQILIQDLLSEAIPLNLTLLNTLKLPMFSELVATPEVQAAISQRQRDTDSMREQVLEQLQQPEWNP